MKRLALAIVVVLALPASALVADMNVLPAKCALQGIELIGAQWRMGVLSNGLEDYMFDLDGDFKADIELLVPQGDENRIPQFYWMNDNEGKVRYTLSDTKRDGACGGMKIVWHMYQPDYKKGA